METKFQIIQKQTACCIHVFPEAPSTLLCPITYSQNVRQSNTPITLLLPGLKEECPVDHYQDETEASSCKRCPPGYHCKITGISDYSGYK